MYQEPKGVFVLQPACKVSEIRSDINKKRKQFLFRVTWPPEDEIDDESTIPLSNSDSKRTSGSRKSATIKRKPMSDSSSGMSVGKIAALAVGGVVVGALTAGVGLVAGMVVVGMGAAASGGAVAISQGRSEKEKFLTLACDTYGDAERWTHAIESQIRDLGETLHDFPFVKGYTNNSLSRNAPPEKKLESVQEWVRWSQWKLSAVLDGTRIYERDASAVPSATPPSATASTVAQTASMSLPASLRVLRVNMGMNASTTDVFITLMNMPPACLSGSIKTFRVVESMDNHTDIIYMELDAVFMYPTNTSKSCSDNVKVGVLS